MDSWAKKYKHLLYSTIGWSLALAAFLLLANRGQAKAIVNVVGICFVAGALGATINNYRRFFLIPDNDEADRFLRRPQVVTQIYLSPFIGGLLAWAVYLAALAQLLDGKLFPHFINADGKYCDLHGLLFDMSPAQNIDAAKAILWSVVAGFSERFVPNILDRAATTIPRGDHSSH